MFFFDASGNNNESGFDKHYHDVMEFYYLTKGQCNYLIENKLYDVIEGDLVYIPKRVIHETTYPTPHSRMLINCSDDFADNMPKMNFSVFRNKNASAIIKDIFFKIKEEYTLNDRFSENIIKGYMQQLLAITSRFENTYHNRIAANKYTELVLEYVHSNYCSEITLTAVANDFGITKEHLSRVFKKETGLNFSQYLVQLRMKKAEKMLCYGNETISEIAYSCGFNDSNYFSDKFKKIYKTSPLKYRKANRMHISK